MLSPEIEVGSGRAWSGIQVFLCLSIVEGHDGLGLECWRGDAIVFEIFRNDETLRFEVTMFEQDVPLELLEHAIPTVRKSLGEFVP